MKVRYESRGLHFYDRRTGYHVLLDDVAVPEKTWSKAPSVVSIALTNVCDLACEFCYAPKSKHQLSQTELIQWCAELDTLGALEVAFGGGEPTLYPNLPELCRAIWNETKLGISITTHGHHLTADLIERLKGHVSNIRLSVDAPEPHYSEMRGRPLQRIHKVIDEIHNSIPVSVNTVVNRKTLGHLDELALLVEQWQVFDWLLLPETRDGQFTLSPEEWERLSDIISVVHERLHVSVTFDARPYLNCAFLFDVEPLHDYVHISADGCMRLCSYETGGLPLRNTTLSAALDEVFR